ncbi:cytochrome c oxidase subunit I [Vulgatibacter incomptus]|uniref:Cytochrome c oxidase polypeptide I n=1 Tax=Vulgatibacter incomptus TaxID=1391653 RepID=A0A0K1P9Q6_9BACT|nr:cbb3-type cytochrome c oxidase subunit I [Vulgatibacter incomptus]AKU90245.1 Cytochrome c oxidase polypeptide I [Vulgatibacter incomptus]
MTPKSYLDEETTVWSWLATTDHKRIGVMFFVLTSIALLIGGIFALLLRLEHLTPNYTIMSANAYNQAFTLHGVIMVWFFLIPSIPAAFGNFFVPILLGAQDVAFPRLNLATVYIYIAGAIAIAIGVAMGGTDTGWTFYPPYSSQTFSQLLPILIGVFILGFSTIFTGLNLIVTIHTLRAKGMRFMQMPLFVWTMYGVSVIQVVATPVLGMVLLLTTLDHGLNWGFFDPARGGDVVLFQHFFWFYSHPAVYIMILPAMGVVSEVIPTFAHKNPLSYKAIAFSTFGIAFVGFLTWGHHMFVSGMSVFDAGVFGVLSMFVAIFSAIKVFTWVGTLYKGSVDLRTPLVYIAAFLFLFVFGGMTGVAVATTSLDVHWTDTYFVVAHFHFIMVGASLTAWLAAIHYWWPKMTGRMYSEPWGIAAAVLVFLGFFATFFPQFLLGNGGMPRRYYYYPEKFTTLHVMSTAGSWVLGLGLVIALLYLAWSLFYGPRAPANPWGGRTLEWRIPSPPSRHNFATTPEVIQPPYDYSHPLEGDIHV